MDRRTLGWTGRLLIIGLVASVCASSQGRSIAMIQSTQTVSADLSVAYELQDLEAFPGSVRDGQPLDQDYQPAPVAHTEPLPEAAARALLKRLEPLQAAGASASLLNNRGGWLGH